MSDIPDFMESYQNHAKVLDESSRLNKLTVFAALAEASITLLTVAFNGGGDSGQMEEMTAKAGDKTVPPPAAQVVLHAAGWGTGKLDHSMAPLREVIEQLCFDCLSQEHGGWENNDGGNGKFTFHVEDSRIELDFNQFFTDSTSHTF